MCDSNQVQSVSLQTAVLMQVQEFVNNGTCFSKFDVTKALRQKCNDGVLEIPECEDGSLRSYRFNVTHLAVSAIFEQLWASGVTTQGLPAMTRQYNGTYWVYQVDPNAVPAAPTPVQPTMVSVNPATVTPPSTASLPTINPLSGLSDVELKRRVTIYLDHCAKVGLQPTLKQIQSAIKRGNRSTGLTYREIANVLKGLGRSVPSAV